MKVLIILALIFSGHASANQKMNMEDELLIEGEVNSSIAADEELKAYEKELKNVKGLVQGFKAKKTVLKKLKENASQLAGEFEEYVKEKQSYEKEITEYNLQMKCLGEPNAPECIKKNPLYSYGQEVKGIMAKYRGHFKSCNNKKMNETIITHLSIGELGDLKNIGWEHSPDFKNNDLLRCLGLIIQKIEFPPTPNGQVVKIKQPLQLKVN